MSADSSAKSAFWDFSVAFYARSEVAAACLELQDRFGADVNVVLYLLFAAYHGRLLDTADLERIEALSAPWRQAVVIPLRGVRRVLKSAVGAFEPASTARLRSEIQRIELAAERLQQEALERLGAQAAPGQPCPDRTDCARRHLELYAARIGAPVDGPIARILEQFASLCLLPCYDGRVER